jgi:hypothetical protein
MATGMLRVDQTEIVDLIPSKIMGCMPAQGRAGSNGSGISGLTEIPPVFDSDTVTDDLLARSSIF